MMSPRLLVLFFAANWIGLSAVAAPPPEDRLDALRAEGPAGLAKVIAARDERFPPAETTPQPSSELLAWNAAIDHVAGAKYSHVSGLYWYTDFAAAKAAATKENKPILSLRLLGKLTDELSCANSRFFRTLLYPHGQISQELKDHYILHWQSVRPAPVITIDFGDGRKIVRTITGNSIHYLFSPQGELVDALPGLYGPKAFLDRVQLVAAKCREFESVADAGRRTEKWCAYREEQLQATQTAWSNDLERARPHLPFGEQPPLGTAIAGVSDDVFWRTLGGMRPEESALDDAGRKFVAEMQGPPAAPVAGRLAMTKAIVEIPALRVARNLQGAIGADTARNDYTFRPQILRWLNANAAFRDVDRLNEMVYAELFRTPSNDPWLGLQTPDVFTALPRAGAVQAAAK